MKRFIIASTLGICLFSQASAQTATATGTGIANSRSSSASSATAIGGGQGIGIGGQGGAGGQGTSSAAVTINSTSPANTTATINNTGTSTVRNVPTEFAPGLTAAGLETCLGSVSGGGAFVGTGFSFGSTIPDPGCAARLDARTLWSFGLKKAAVARLCLMTDVYNSMPEVCALYLPRYQQTGVTTAAVTQEPEYTGGPVEVIVARTGEHRMCADYDVNRHRCRVWAR